MPHAPALLLIALVLSTSAAAQTETRSATVYRCGPNGRDLRDAPCPALSGEHGNGASQVEFTQPSSADARAARARAAADAQEAEALERDRLKREAEARRQAAPPIVGLGNPPDNSASEPGHHLVAKRPKPPRPRNPPRAASAAR